MQRRRLTILLAAAPLCLVLAPGVLAQAAPDPLAIVNNIYARVVSGKGDGGGGFVVRGKAARAKYLSPAFAELWNRADARTPNGDLGPIDFDPVTNAQDPDVTSFTATSESRKEQRATVAVNIKGATARATAADAIIHYDFVRDAGQWKIDDIRGMADGRIWMVRGMLINALKN